MDVEDINEINELKEIFESYQSSIGLEREVIADISDTLNLFNGPVFNEPGISVTANNKLGEIYRQLKNANISLTNSIIGMAVLTDFDIVSEKSLNALENLNNETNNILKKRVKQVDKLDNEPKIVTFIRNILPSKFVKQPIDAVLFEDENKVVSNYVKQYKETVDHIYNYSLEKDLVPSIISYFEENYENNFDDIKIRTKEEIIPAFVSLGLQEKLPNLKLAISQYIKNYSTNGDIVNTELKSSCVRFKGKDEELER